MIEKFKTAIPLYFITVNPILIYDIPYLIPFCLQESLARIYFSKEYFFARKNDSQEYLFSGKLWLGVDISL